MARPLPAERLAYITKIDWYHFWKPAIKLALSNGLGERIVTSSPLVPSINNDGDVKGKPGRRRLGFLRGDISLSLKVLFLA
jgi:hypothetical protein